METLATYLRTSCDGLTPEEAEMIYQGYCDSLDLTDEYFRDEYQKLVMDAIAYANMRAVWSQMSFEEQMAADDGRTAMHDRFLHDVERHASYLKRNGLDLEWFELLGQGIRPELVSLKRKRIGDWACYIALFHALGSR